MLLYRGGYLAGQRNGDGLCGTPPPVPGAASEPQKCRYAAGQLVASVPLADTENIPDWVAPGDNVRAGTAPAAGAAIGASASELGKKAYKVLSDQFGFINLSGLKLPRIAGGAADATASGAGSADTATETKRRALAQAAFPDAAGVPDDVRAAQRTAVFAAFDALSNDERVKTLDPAKNTFNGCFYRLVPGKKTGMYAADFFGVGGPGGFGEIECQTPNPDSGLLPGTYTGELHAGLPSGFGIHKHPNGSVDAGEYRRGKLNGDGLRMLRNRAVGVGQFVGGRPIGEFIVYHPNNDFGTYKFNPDGSAEESINSPAGLLKEQVAYDTSGEKTAVKYFRDGQLRESLPYTNGKVHGDAILLMQINGEGELVRSSDGLPFTVTYQYDQIKIARPDMVALMQQTSTSCVLVKVFSTVE